MDMNQQILQKILEMEEAQKQRDAEQRERDAEQKARDAEQKARDAAQKQRDADLDARLTSLESEVAEIRKEQVAQGINQARLEGKLQTAETRLGGKLENLEMKVDNFLTNMRERKADSGERWKVGGIIASCSIAIAALIVTILSRLGGN